MNALYAFGAFMMYVVIGSGSLRLFMACLGDDFFDCENGDKIMYWVHIFSWPIWWVGAVVIIVFRYLVYLPVKFIARI